MDEQFYLKFTGAQLWQAGIPVSSLQRLKSHAMLKFKDFWPEDYGESPGLPHSEVFYAKEISPKNNRTPIPADDAATISVVDCDDEPIDGFELENELSLFSRIEIRHASSAQYDFIFPKGFNIVSSWMDYFKYLAGIDQKYIARMEDIVEGPEGLSSVNLGIRGFIAEIPFDFYSAPKSPEDIILVISSFAVSSLKFEFLHGLIIKGKFHDLRSFESESYSDIFYTTYYDEALNLIASFNHWHGGLDIDEIGEMYISKVSDEVIDAYRAADFKVNFDPEFILKIGVYSEQLSEIHKKNNCSVSAFVTAWNPLGKISSGAENQALHKSLKETVSDRYAVIDGIGCASSGKWHGEESLLIIGITREDAMELGRKYNQNAIVFNYDSVPELIMLR